MPKIGRGVPAPAKFKDIIDDLFENEKIKYQDETREILTFSRAKLNDQQKSSLAANYPEGLIALDVEIFYQIDIYDAHNDLSKSNLILVSFVKKNDGFIYGVYFKVLNQQRLEIEQLKKSKQPIELSNNAEFVDDNYLEVYNNIFDTTFILGLSTLNQQISASLQYTHKSLYFYENLLQNGIEDPQIPKTSLTGLSKNLSHFD